MPKKLAVDLLGLSDIERWLVWMYVMYKWLIRRPTTEYVPPDDRDWSLGDQSRTPVVID